MALNRPLAVGINARLSIGIGQPQLVVTPTTPAPDPTERITTGDFSSDVGWDTNGTDWVIAAGTATCAVAGARLTNTLSTQLVGGESFDIAIDCTANTLGTSWGAQLFNSVTLDSQLVLIVSEPSTGTKTNSGTVSGPFDQLYIMTADDAGITIDNVSLLA